MNSTEFDHDSLPDDLENSSVQIGIEIGIKGIEGANLFYLTAIPPKALALNPGIIWGRGYLILP